MRKNELRARSAVKRDLAAIALPTKLQLQKIISELQNLVYSALRTGETTDIEKVCQERLLALLDAGTEVAVLKGGRRGQLSSEKVIDEPISEIMPVRFSLQDKGTVQAQGTAKYLRRISGIDPTRTNNEFRKQNAVLINGLSKEICDTVRKTIVDLTKLGVHVRGGKKEISDILLNAGLDPAATPRLAETIFRTQTAAAYNAGRWNIVNDSDTAPYIWGFQYCTAHDRRVRPEHRLLEGVRLPKDDPFWKRYFPPNGWNCRCTVLEIWNDEETACEDFGITGVDPRKRSPKELNLLPAFDGNAGILGYGRGGSGGGIKDNIPASPKPSLEEAKEARTEEKEKVEGKKEKKDQNDDVNIFIMKKIELEGEILRAIERLNIEGRNAGGEEKEITIQYSKKKTFSDEQRYCWTLFDNDNEKAFLQLEWVNDLWIINIDGVKSTYYHAYEALKALGDCAKRKSKEEQCTLMWKWSPKIKLFSERTPEVEKIIKLVRDSFILERIDGLDEKNFNIIVGKDKGDREVGKVLVKRGRTFRISSAACVSVRIPDFLHKGKYIEVKRPEKFDDDNIRKKMEDGVDQYADKVIIYLVDYNGDAEALSRKAIQNFKRRHDYNPVEFVFWLKKKKKIRLHKYNIKHKRLRKKRGK